MLAGQAGKRLLLIDDNIVTREMLSMLLAGEGYRVATAGNGVEALERLHEFERPDLILLDLRMPVMDGCAFCEQRKREFALADIPVVVLSGRPDVAEQAALLGAAGYLQKPFDTIALLHTVRTCCPDHPTSAATT